MSEAETLEYRPKAGSVPWKVIRFLLDNPDEELTRGDIAVKFDTFGGSLDTVLQIACSRGVLKKGRNSDMEVVWMLGANRDGVVMDEWTEPPATDLVKAMSSSPAITAPDGFPEIRKNTPLMDERTRRKLEFHAWLAKFEVNDSAEFPESFKGEVQQMVKSYSEVSKREFHICKVGSGRWGVERRK